MPTNPFRALLRLIFPQEGKSRVFSLLSIFLALVAVVSGIAVFTRDINWKKRAVEARKQGESAYKNGNHARALTFFSIALENNPYDWRSHLHLANMLFRRFNDLDEALKHYLYTLAYTPDPAVAAEANSRIEIIRLIRSGQIENPHDVINDMFYAVENGAIAAFMRRLSTNLREDRMAYWNGWRKRGRGTVEYMNISSIRNGFYDAFIELRFPDATVMSLRLICPLREVWRLELSFP